MYARFYRWASDRIDKNGVLAFITNRSFIDSRTFDGFRKTVASEFNAIYIIDLGGDVRTNPKLSGTKNNVFGIQTGVAIMILVRQESNFKEALTKKELKELKEDLNIVSEPVVLYKQKEFFSTQGCRIYYVRRPEMETREEKLDFLRSNKIENLEFDRIAPDKNNNWIDLADNDFDSLLPLCSKEVKAGRSMDAIFGLYSTGVVTARDEWVYDDSEDVLEKKIKFFIGKYNTALANYKDEKDLEKLGTEIKWSRNLKNHLKRGHKFKYESANLIKSLKRPFYKPFFYFEKGMNDEIGYFKSITFDENRIIGINNNSPIFNSLANDSVFDFASLIVSSGQTQCLPIYRYDEKGRRVDNITDWGLAQFRHNYEGKAKQKFSDEREKVDYYSKSKGFKITKEDIFHYTYAVLHNPAYRKKYELNLKREFPRLPFYKDFWQWAKWGKQLMDLHINYEKAKPFPLKEKTYEVKAEAKRQKEIFSQVKEPEAMYARQPKIKPKLKADKEAGVIDIDELTFLTGVPKEAYEYKLGNRSAIEWVLDQYKEKKPSDLTIAEKFNTYRFADYKEQVIDLLKRVCTVSVETMEIVRKMENEKS